MKNIKFDDGYKSFSINGDSNRVIRFNPADIGIVARIEQTEKKFEELEEKLKACTEEGAVEALKHADSAIKEQFDYMFNSDVSDVLFGGQSAVCTVKGEFLFMRIMEAVLPIVKEEIEKEQKASETRISKYTEQYIK